MVNSRTSRYLRRLWRGRLLIGMIVLSTSLLSMGCQDVQSSSSTPAGIPEEKVDNVSIASAIGQESLATIAPPPATLTAFPTSVAESVQGQERATETRLPTLTPTPPLLLSPTLLPPTLFPTANHIATILPVTPPATSPTPVVSLTIAAPLVFSIGESVHGRPIYAYQFGNGSRHIIFIGGIHGGYEWNTILLAYKMIDYFQENPEAVPETITLSIIPSANPDGQVAVTGQEGEFSPPYIFGNTVPGRLNGNKVDLNRNWDCQWAPTAVWRQEEVSAGSGPFSEPETQALRRFFEQRQPEAVIFWHSKANGVFAADCPDPLRPFETHQLSLELAEHYGNAAGYPVYENFTSYPITGDAGDWLTKVGITSITVELRNHEDPDENMNLKGILAVLDYYR